MWATLKGKNPLGTLYLPDASFFLFQGLLEASTNPPDSFCTSRLFSQAACYNSYAQVCGKSVPVDIGANGFILSVILIFKLGIARALFLFLSLSTIPLGTR